jgi:hypothetical protein
MWGSQSSSGKRIEAMARSLEEQGQVIVEQGQAIAQQAVRIDASMRQTAGIAREVVALGDQMMGRLRQLDDKFGKFLGVLERETVSSKSFRALEERVRRLEQQATRPRCVLIACVWRCFWER